MPRHLPPQYLNPHQSRTHEATADELALAAAIELAFTDGATELEELVAAVNAQGVPAPDGTAWTVESFSAEMRRLGE